MTNEYEVTGECEVTYNGQRVFFDYVYRCEEDDCGDIETGPYMCATREELTIMMAFDEDGDEIPYDKDMYKFLEQWVADNEDLRE